MAKEKKFITCDGNTAAAHVSYIFTEVAAIKDLGKKWFGFSKMATK